MNDTPRVGNRLKLNPSSPMMLVTSVNDSGFSCSWTEGDEHKAGEFPLGTAYVYRRIEQNFSGSGRTEWEWTIEDGWKLLTPGSEPLAPSPPTPIDTTGLFPLPPPIGDQLSSPADFTKAQ